VASMTKCHKLPPCPTKSTSAISKTEPPLAVDKPVSNSGSASVITYLRRGKNPLCNTTSNQKRGVRRYERNNSADSKVIEEGGGRGPSGTGADISLQSVEKTMMKKAVPQKPMEVHSGADTHLQPVEEHMLEQMDAPKEAVTPMGSL